MIICIATEKAFERSTSWRRAWPPSGIEGAHAISPAPQRGRQKGAAYEPLLRDMHKSIHGGTIPNNQEMEITQVCPQENGQRPRCFLPRRTVQVTRRKE